MRSRRHHSDATPAGGPGPAAAIAPAARDAAASRAAWWAELSAHVIEHGPLFLVSVRPDGRVLRVNDTACRITGYTRCELLAANYWDLLYPGELRAQVDALLAAFRRSSKVRDYPMTLATRDGAHRVIAWTSLNRLDERGAIAEIVGVGVDVTASEEHARALLRSERRLGDYTEHDVENSPSFIVAVTPDGRATSINAAGCRFLDCSRDQILGANLWQALFPGPLQAQVADLFARFERAGGVRDHEMTMRSFSGVEHILSWTSVNRCDDAGQLVEIIVIGHDVTELRRSQAQLCEAQDIAGLGSWELDVASGRLRWSDAALRVLGLEREQIGRTLESFLNRVHPDDRAQIEHDFPIALRNGGLYETTYRLLGPDGNIRHIHGRCRNTYDVNGWAVRSAGTVQDMTAAVEQREQLERALDETVRVKAYHEHVVENSPAIIIATSPRGLTTAINDAACRVLGYRRADLLGRNLWTTLCPGKKFRQVEAMFREYDRRGCVKDYEMVIETAVGEERVWSWNSVNRVDERGRLIEAVGMATDITELKRSQLELQYLAHHDQLTGLPNRLLLSARLDHALAQAQRRGGRGALLFVDLDRFKNINDSLGHPTGDALLRAAAERLRNCVRGEDTVARLSGDEFTLLIDQVADDAAAVQVAEKVLAAFHEPFRVETQEVAITPSIGISLFPRDGEDIDNLLRNADSAMYEAKGQGRNAWALYTRRMSDAALGRVQLENDLRRALGNDELALYFQPQVELASGRLSGAEALLRWRHPEHGLVPPDRFVPIAEESGLIIPIGEWVLHEACRTARAWLDRGVPLGAIAVNVAAPQIRRRNLAGMVEAALAASGLPATRLELEVTEGFIMSEAEHAIDQLNALRELGVRLSIDDFGTGYSSLSYLKRLPLHQLKIDRSFVRDIPDDADDMAITEAVIALARSLRLAVVAEGVETEAQRRFLLAKGCEHGQGFLFQPPVAADDFLAWYAAHDAPRDAG